MSSAAKIIVARKRITLEIKRGSPRGFAITRSAPRKIIVQRHAFGGGGAVGRTDQVDVINPVADGQVQFLLSRAPLSAASVRMIINGTRYRPPDFTVDGQAVTWGSPFSLTPNDEIEFTYPI